MGTARKVYVVRGYAEDMCAALGVSRSWLSNACKNGGKLKGLDVYQCWTDKEEPDADGIAMRAVDALGKDARERLRTLLKGV